MIIEKIVIVEDEKPNADRLKRLLAELRPQASVIAVLESVKASVEWFTKHDSPDVVIMDIRLADGLSFEIFNLVSVHCPVIFTTAYDEYAVKAFKYNSVDYLLKPVEKEELEHAVNKRESMPSRLQGLSPELENLLAFVQPRHYRERFLLPYRDSYKTVLVNDVAYFSSELNITQARFFNGEVVSIPQTLEKLEKQLDPKKFFRANRRYIISIEAIKEVHNYFNGKLKVDLKVASEEEIVISREKASLLKTWMDY